MIEIWSLLIIIAMALGKERTEVEHLPEHKIQSDLFCTYPLLIHFLSPRNSHCLHAYFGYRQVYQRTHFLVLVIFPRNFNTQSRPT